MVQQRVGRQCPGAAGLTRAVAVHFEGKTVHSGAQTQRFRLGWERGRNHQTTSKTFTAGSNPAGASSTFAAPSGSRFVVPPVTPRHRPAFPLRVRLFHFSEDPCIREFVPRVPEHRPDIEPLVWAVDEERAWTYYFPRDCPRILLWPTPETTPEDLEHWFGNNPRGRIACLEHAWLERMRTARVYRYEFDPAHFVSLEDDPWMLVSPEVERPVSVEPLPGDLVDALGREGVEVRILPGLLPLWGAWEHSFHFSGIRLRNAQGWPRHDPPLPVS